MPLPKQSGAGLQPLLNDQPTPVPTQGRGVTPSELGVGQAPGKGDQLFVNTHAVFQKDTINPPVTISTPPSITGTVGKPALSGNLLVFELDGRIEALDLATGLRTLDRGLQTEAQASP